MSLLSSPRTNFTSDTDSSKGSYHSFGLNISFQDEEEKAIETAKEEERLIDRSGSFIDDSRRFEYCYYEKICTPMQYRVACAALTIFLFGTLLVPITTIVALNLPISTVVSLVMGIVSGYFFAMLIGIPLYSAYGYSQWNKQ
ncbi:MAG: hypothetical protein SNF33_06855 [Candidatus Algichlamydia australiensis]|nr:hypothetical protein [Chlamydiales bacterium]